MNYFQGRQRKIDSISYIQIQTAQYINKIEGTLTGNLLFQELTDENTIASPLEEMTPTEENSNPQDVNDIEDSSLSLELPTFNPNLSFLIRDDLIPPVQGVVTSRFKPSDHHYGVDIAVSQYSPIVSIADGVVILSEYTLETGFVIIVKHTDNFLSVYKHNSSLKKKQGQKVSTGEVIAFGGNTGELSTGHHLHFELWIDNQPIDPTQIFAF